MNTADFFPPSLSCGSPEIEIGSYRIFTQPGKSATWRNVGLAAGIPDPRCMCSLPTKAVVLSVIVLLLNMLGNFTSWKLPKQMPIRLTSMAKIAQFPRFDWVLRFDGGSRGNPGEAGCGAVIYANSKSTLKEVWCGYFYMGNSLTNNQAEYGGLIEGLKQCVTMKLKSLEIQGDSQLIIRQVQGVYQCRNEKLKPLYQKVHKLLAKFSSISFMHIRRAENARADALANTAMDKESSFSYYTNFTEYESLLKSTVESGLVSMDQAAPARVRKPRTKKVSVTESTGANDSADAGSAAPTKVARKPREKKVTEVETTITTDSTASATAAAAVVVVEVSGEVSEEGDAKEKKPRATRAKKVKDAAVVEGLVSNVSVVELPGL